MYDVWLRSTTTGIDVIKAPGRSLSFLKICKGLRERGPPLRQCGYRVGWRIRLHGDKIMGALLVKSADLVADAGARLANTARIA